MKVQWQKSGTEKIPKIHTFFQDRQLLINEERIDLSVKDPLVKACKKIAQEAANLEDIILLIPERTSLDDDSNIKIISQAVSGISIRNQTFI